jgi:uncharacterized membrane protein YcaP (DUF421 family)
MFEPTADWWEIIFRVSLLYLFLLTFLRISGKRELGQLGPMDLLTMLLIAETVSPALTAEDDSLTTAMIASGTLFILTIAMATATYFSRIVERVVEGAPRVLVRAGVLDDDVQRAERITDSELEAAMRKQGLRSLAQVDEAVVETDGQISFLKRNE